MRRDQENQNGYAEFDYTSVNIPSSGLSIPKRGLSSGGRGITRVISFTGGKGGVGKTNCVINVGIALAKSGKSVLILDADLGLANVDIMLGIRPNRTISDVIFGDASLEEVMVAGPHGLSIIPAASGVEQICRLTESDRLKLFHAIEEVAAHFDYLLIDTQAGIGSDVVFFNTAATEIVCVITADPTSLTDAYALIKILSQNYGEKRFGVLVNQVDCRNGSDAAQAGRPVFNRLSAAVQRHLNIQLSYIGAVPADSAVTDAVRNQTAVVDYAPSSHAARSLELVASQIDQKFFEFRVKGGVQFFFQNLLQLS